MKDILLKVMWINIDSCESQLAQSQFIMKDEFHNHTLQAIASRCREALSRLCLVPCGKEGLK